MTGPCDSCPFLRGTPMRLSTGRVEEITAMLLNTQGGSFPCHKTTEFGDDGEHLPHSKEVHCAGALIFMEKHQTQTQIVRIAHRLGIYDPDKLANHDLVFGSVQEMINSICQ